LKVHSSRWISETLPAEPIIQHLHKRKIGKFKQHSINKIRTLAFGDAVSMYNNLTEEGLRAQAMQLQKEIEELETEYAQIAMQIQNKRAMLNRISELLEIKGTTILQ
jgi:hypothetical protein